MFKNFAWTILRIFLKIEFSKAYVYNKGIYNYLSVRKDNLSWIDPIYLPQDFQKKGFDPIPTFDIKFGAAPRTDWLLAIIS